MKCILMMAFYYLHALHLINTPIATKDVLNLQDLNSRGGEYENYGLLDCGVLKLCRLLQPFLGELTFSFRAEIAFWQRGLLEHQVLVFHFPKVGCFFRA